MDDIHYEFTTTWIQPTSNEKKFHSPKDFNYLKEIPSCYAAYAITIESQKKDNRQSKRHPAWTVQDPFHILYGDQLNIW